MVDCRLRDLAVRYSSAGTSHDRWGMAGVCAMRRRQAHSAKLPRWFGMCPRRLGAVFPNAVFGWLAATATDELSGAYLLRAGRWFRLALSLRALATWRERATLLWGLCVPPADYLLAKYRVRNCCLLPWLYTRRIVAGVWKFRKS